MAQQQENNASSTSSRLFSLSSDFEQHSINNDDRYNNASVRSDLDTTATTATTAVAGGLAGCVMRTFAARWTGGLLKKAATIAYFVCVLSCRMLLKSQYAEQLGETTTACLQDVLALAPFVVGLVLLQSQRDKLLRPKPPPSPAANSREPAAVNNAALQTPAAVTLAAQQSVGPENLKLYLFAI